MDSINDIAHEVQHYVPTQPWGPSGHNPVGIEIFYDDVYGEPWYVKAVFAVSGPKGRRHYVRARGKTLEEALVNARAQQRQAAAR